MSTYHEEQRSFSCRSGAVPALGFWLFSVPHASRVRPLGCDNGKRFVVRADEKLTAFVELETTIRSCDELPLLRHS